MNDKIIIKGAKVNNLKNVSLTIPRDKLIVFTGLSGSGKSSLAFDTLYALPKKSTSFLTAALPIPLILHSRYI